MPCRSWHSRRVKGNPASVKSPLHSTGNEIMKSEYDLSTMKSRNNPYAAKLKKSVSMRLSEDVVTYFKDMANDAP